MIAPRSIANWSALQSSHQRNRRPRLLSRSKSSKFVREAFEREFMVRLSKRISVKALGKDFISSYALMGDGRRFLSLQREARVPSAATFKYRFNEADCAWPGDSRGYANQRRRENSLDRVAFFSFLSFFIRRFPDKRCGSFQFSRVSAEK